MRHGVNGSVATPPQPRGRPSPLRLEVGDMSRPQTLEPPAPRTAPSTAATVAVPHPQDSWAQVSAAQRGDSEAFGWLYAEYAQVVYRYVLLRVGDHCLAEDDHSETLLPA